MVVDNRIIEEYIKHGKLLSEKAKNINFDDGILLDHNKEAYVDIVDAMECDGKACAVRATGTGKMYLAAKLLYDNPGKRFVYIAPTNVILNKFVDTLVDVCFDKEDAKRIKEKSLEDEIKILEEKFGFHLHLYTYARINLMDAEEMQKIKADYIVVDEFHRCGADKWGKSVNEFLRANSNAKILGLSATPIRPSDGKNIVDEMFDGKIASELTLVEALEKGILQTPIMVNAIYSFMNELVTVESQLANKKFSPNKKKKIDNLLKQARELIGKSGDMKAIFSDFVEETTRAKGKQDIKMVVFCGNIADRDKKMDECNNWFEKGSKIKKYSLTSKESGITVKVDSNLQLSAKSKKLRQKVIQAFEDDNSKGVKILFVVDMLDEGFHVKGLDAVVMLNATESYRVFLQRLGRALAVDKNRTTPPWVFDLQNSITTLCGNIKEYREIIRQLSANKKNNEELKHYIDFKIQSQVISLIQCLKDMTYTFEDRIAPLAAYYEEHGTIANIKKSDIYTFNGEDFNIGVLINTLRREKKKNKLDSKKVRKLESMGMVWDKTITFEDRIVPLVAYYKEHGTIASIKTEEEYEFNGKVCKIGNLVHDFRKKRDKLEAEEIRKLESMGMVWDKTVTFEDRITPLVAYYKEHGTLANIKSDEMYEFNGEMFKIGSLITTLRYQEKKGGLKTEEIHKLERMGMVWVKHNFEDRIAPLVAYYEEYGTIANIRRCEIYKFNGKIYRIGNLIHNLRNKTKKGELKPGEIFRLESMGMVWNMRESEPSTQDNDLNGDTVIV